MRARPFDRSKDVPSQDRKSPAAPPAGAASGHRHSAGLSARQQHHLLRRRGRAFHLFGRGRRGAHQPPHRKRRRQILALMLPGDLFGIPEAGLYANSAETVCPATLYRVPWQQLHEMMMEEPDMQVSLLMRVAFDLRQAQRRIVMLGQHNIIPAAGILSAGAGPASRFLQSPRAAAGAAADPSRPWRLSGGGVRNSGARAFEPGARRRDPPGLASGAGDSRHGRAERRDRRQAPARARRNPAWERMTDGRTTRNRPIR